MAAVLKQSRCFYHIFKQVFVNKPLQRFISVSSQSYCDGKPPGRNKSTPAGVLSKYEPFKDNRSPVIMDVEEERRKVEEDFVEEIEEYNEFEGISSSRGVHGVLDVEELVDILRKENAMDIFVVTVPPEYRYVQHMVIVSGKSGKHMLGMAEFIRKVYKYKMKGKEIIPMLEGKGSQDWIALDLGNIALHIFSRKVRGFYDLESLWSVGSAFDKICNQPDDPLIQMLKEHSVYIGEPSDNTNQ